MHKHSVTAQARHHQQAHHALRVPRRQILRAGGVLALGLPSIARADRPAATGGGRLDERVIRLASVRTVQDGGLLQSLVAEFEGQTGYAVVIHTGEDVYERARAGEADLVFSHFGHHDAQAFLTEGLGQWPHAVLFNQTALLGHPSDPADVRSAPDPVEAFRRIAHARAPFVANDIDGQQYLADTLWHAAGRPEKAGWYRDTGLRQVAAARAAAAEGGYTLWGLTPFLVSQQQSSLDLSPFIFNDALVQRVMVSVVVDPARFPQVNAAGALAFQQYLLTPETQAQIRNHRYPGIDQPIFWPAGRNNATALLP